MDDTRKYVELFTEIEELKTQLAEAHDTLHAIHTGEVDALIVKNGNGHELYTLKSADQTYRIFIEKMAEGAVTLNKDGVVLYCNSSFANMLGLPLANVLGEPFESFIPAKFNALVSHAIKKAWREESKAELILPGSNNKSIPVLLSLNKMEIDGGTALSIIITDLSFQKETQEQLREKNQQLEEAQLVTNNLNDQLERTVRERTNELYKSRENFKFLADNIPAIVWTADANGRIDYFNKRWFEYTSGNTGMLNNELHSFIHPDELESYRTDWKNCVEAGIAFEKVHRFKHSADGLYKWHHSRALPLKNEKDEVLAWFGISTDIDEQKRALEKKDEFISIASHELKTPVTSIKGYVQLLRFSFQKEGNREAVDLLTKADIQINKLTNLIGDLLDVKKIENGQLQYHPKPFDFNELVREIAEETGRVLKSHIVKCELGETFQIYGDRNKIGQVITNFIDNAGKYSPADTMILVRSSVNNNKVNLSVQDFGIGIPKEQLSRIFERFFRVGGEVENTYSGLGLGLYISAEIIKRHHGTIGVESEHGIGSTFYFELPIS